MFITLVKSRQLNVENEQKMSSKNFDTRKEKTKKFGTHKKKRTNFDTRLTISGNGLAGSFKMLTCQNDSGNCI